MPPTPADPAPGHSVRWPSDRFYWALLDAPGVRASGPLPIGLIPDLADLTPVDVDSLHAACAPAGADRLLVCAAAVAELRELDAGTLHLSPADLPAFAAGSSIDLNQLNLLVGRFEPAAIVRQRSVRRIASAVAAATCLALIGAGFSARAEAWKRADREAQVRTATLLESVMPDDGGDPRLKTLLIKDELKSLRRLAAADPGASRDPDAAAALAHLLAAWPDGLDADTELVSITPTTMSLTVSLKSEPRAFTEALPAIPGWVRDEPRLSGMGTSPRLLIQHRREGRRP